MAKTKTAATKTQKRRTGTKTTARRTAGKTAKGTAPINARRAGAKALAKAIAARGESFGREVWGHWEGMRSTSQRVAQVESRATH